MPKYFGNTYEYGQKEQVLTAIKEVLQNAGRPLGVNQIARHIDKPVATIHKYLKSQNYLVQTEDKKWRFPDTLEDIYAEDRITSIIELTKGLHDKKTLEVVLEALHNGNDRAALRTELLKEYVKLESLLYELKRSVDFWKTITTNALDQR